MKMMKFFLFAAAAVAAISCAKELSPIENANPTPEVERVPMMFTASYAETTETKVALDENGATVWQPGDKIMVISAYGDANEFEAIEVTNGGKSATFKGLIENANEYYAVYPASAYKGTPEYVTEMQDGKPTGKLVVEVPNVQQAVAGTFHPSAILCIANTKGTNFTFKHSCAFLKFNFANPEGVKSVRLSVNDSDNVAGIGYVGVNDTDINTKYPTTDKNMSKYDMITLNAPEGGFVAGENYYIAMRANSCKEGITAYIEYEDKVMSRTNNKKVFAEYDENGNEIASGSIGRIKNLGQLDKNLKEVTPYDTYNLGCNIVIAGEIINKETYKDANLINSADQLITTPGLYFVDPEATNLSINSGSYYTGSGLYIIGNTLTGRVDLKINGMLTSKGGFMNLNIIENCSTDMFKPAQDGNILLDNCHLTTSSGKSQIFYSGTSVNKFAMHNCDIKVTANAKQLWKLNGSGVFNTFELVNNIFYASSADGYQNFNVCQYGTITNLVYQYNTMAEVYNAFKGSTGSHYQYFPGMTAVSDIQFNNNLFYLTKYAEANYANGSYSSIIKATTYPTSGNVIYNVMLSTLTNSRLKITDGTMGFTAEQTTCSPEADASKLVDKEKTDVVNGIIVPINKYGATR